jgi:6-phosphofructokinase 2
MKAIVTLTLNPAIDGSSEAETVRHTNKVRTSNERYDPGGGGINVARVLGELGAPALALYMAGGATGDVLDALLDERGLSRRRIPIADHTRISHVVFERSSGKEYRFVAEGPELREDEIAAFLEAIADCGCEYLVASGSLPRGTPVDFYARVADIAAGAGARLVLDTSGPALKAALDHGGVHLVKPSHGEFEALVGRKLDTIEAIGEAAREFVEAGRVDIIAVTLGHEGAVLASREGVFHRDVPQVEVKSAVGAGDSFVAGMTFGLATGLSHRDAFLLGMAAGTAAVLTPGTELCRKEDVLRLFEELKRS